MKGHTQFGIKPPVVQGVSAALSCTWVSDTASHGANVKAVQKMLGHASAAMTLDIYADLFDDDLEAVAAAFTTLALAKVWAKCGHGVGVDRPICGRC